MKRAISVLIVFSVLLGVLPCIALAADSALRFIDSMFDAEKGLFYTGTTDDGRTQSRDNIVLDAQVWAALALGEQFEPYKPAIAYTVDNLRTAQGGYAFHEDNEMSSCLRAGCLPRLSPVSPQDLTCSRASRGGTATSRTSPPWPGL